MSEPISIEEARDQLRLDGGDRDADLARYVRDAREWVERYTGHLLIRQTVTEQFAGTGPALLRAWPVAADAPFSASYADTSGNAVAMTGARLDVSRRPARIVPVARAWPFQRTDQPYAVTVEAGYADADTVPGNMRRAMLVLIGAYEADREGGTLFAAAEASARSLCRSYRRRQV